eukprot:1934516-Pyramimonas_sp.AAC.1
MGSRWDPIGVPWDPHGGRGTEHILKHFPVGILKGSSSQPFVAPLQPFVAPLRHFVARSLPFVAPYMYALRGLRSFAP